MDNPDSVFSSMHRRYMEIIENRAHSIPEETDLLKELIAILHDLRKFLLEFIVLALLIFGISTIEVLYDGKK